LRKPNLRRAVVAMLQKKVEDLSDERATAAALRRVRPLRNRPRLDWHGCVVATAHSHPD
jgi:hypothetical protein